MRYSEYRKLKLRESILYQNVTWRYKTKQEMSERLTNPDDLVYLDEYEIESIYKSLKKEMPNSVSGRDEKIVQIVDKESEEKTITIKISKHSTGWYIANLIITSERVEQSWYVCPQNGIAGLEYLCAILIKEIKNKK